MTKRYFSKTRRIKGGEGGEGGEDWDIEKGTVIDIPPLRRIPSDPVRKREELGKKFTKSILPDEAEAFFSGPTPEEISKQASEQTDLNVAQYTDYSGMPLFSEGGRRRTRRTRRCRRKSRKTRRVRRRTKRYHKK